MRPLKALLLGLLALALLAGCDDAGLDGQAPPTPPEEREQASPFAVPALEGGGQVALADYRGTPVVLNFWASWCGPCEREMPALVDFATQNPEVAVVGLAVTDVPRDSRRFAERFGVPFDLGIDRDGGVATDFGVSGLPVTVIVDREGRVANTVFGEVTQDDLELFVTALG